MLDQKDWGNIVGKLGTSQYENRIKQLKAKNMDTTAIEITISKTMESFNYDAKSSFIIFGEPQSGKTEMMIALNAKLLDEGCNVIINLLMDNNSLLQQNFSRFQKAGLSPSPKQFSDLPSDAKAVLGKQWIIFSKKKCPEFRRLKQFFAFCRQISHH
jgi:primosomal protein N'